MNPYVMLMAIPFMIYMASLSGNPLLYNKENIFLTYTVTTQLLISKNFWKQIISNFNNLHMNVFLEIKIELFIYGIWNNTA